MKKQIILSSLFTLLTTSVCLIALPDIAHAEREKYRNETSSKKMKQPSHSSRRQVESKRHTRDDRFRHERYKPSPYSKRYDAEKSRRKYDKRYDRNRRTQLEYKSRRQHYPEYRQRPRIVDRGRISRRPHRVIINHPRHYYRGIVYLQPHRHYYPHRYRPLYLKDNNIWAWIAFTAITLKILDNLNDQQQREHERAIYGSIDIPIGDSMTWSRGSASGSITPIWEGRSNTGLYCREFRQEVTINDRTEVAHGTACRRNDDSWEIVD